MNPLEIRKQLLIAEADVLRAQMVEDVWVIRIGAKECRRQAKKWSSVASAVALAIAGFKAIRGHKSHVNGSGGDGHEKGSLFSRLISGARLATGIWSAFSSREHD